MIVLGVDPGLQVTGCVIVDDSSKFDIKLLEEIKTKRTDDFSLRIKKIFDNLDRIIKTYKPEVLVLEKLYSHHKHPLTSSLLGHVRGVIMLSAQINGVKIVEFAATHLKKAITGAGRSSKDQMKKMTGFLAGLKDPVKSEHIADALGLVLTFINTKKYNDRTS